MIPRTLKIRGHVFQIRQVPQKAMGKDVSAMCDSNRNIIWLYRKAVASRKVELIIHEAIHALLDGHDFEDEEAIAVILGEGLTEFIKANPGFIRHALKTLSR